MKRGSKCIDGDTHFWGELARTRPQRSNRQILDRRHNRHHGEPSVEYVGNRDPGREICQYHSAERGVSQLVSVDLARAARLLQTA